MDFKDEKFSNNNDNINLQYFFFSLFWTKFKKKLIFILLQFEPSNGPYTTPTFGQSYLGTVIFTTRAALTDFKDDEKPHEESSILAP